MESAANERGTSRSTLKSSRCGSFFPGVSCAGKGEKRSISTSSSYSARPTLHSLTTVNDPRPRTMFIQLGFLAAACLVWPRVTALPQVEESQYLTRLKAKLFDEDLITLGSGKSSQSSVFNLQSRRRILIITLTGSFGEDRIHLGGENLPRLFLLGRRVYRLCPDRPGLERVRTRFGQYQGGERLLVTGRLEVSCKLARRPLACSSNTGSGLA